MKTREELSHNLRTPLTSIRLVLELCIRRSKDLSPEAALEFLSTALEQTKRLESAVIDAEQHAMEEPIEEESNVIVLYEESEESEEPIRVLGAKAAQRTAR